MGQDQDVGTIVLPDRRTLSDQGSHLQGSIGHRLDFRLTKHLVPVDIHGDHIVGPQFAGKIDGNVVHQATVHGQRAIRLGIGGEDDRQGNAGTDGIHQ